MKSKSKKSSTKADSIKAMREASVREEATQIDVEHELETNVFPMAQLEPAEVVAPVEAEPAEVKVLDSRMSQKDAVLSAIAEVTGLTLVPGTKVTLTPEQFITVTQRLVHGFLDNAIVLKDTQANKDKLANELLLALYCRGLAKNWLKKSWLLNGKMPKTKKLA